MKVELFEGRIVFAAEHRSLFLRFPLLGEVFVGPGVFERSSPAEVAEARKRFVARTSEEIRLAMEQAKQQAKQQQQPEPVS